MRCTVGSLLSGDSNDTAAVNDDHTLGQTLQDVVVETRSGAASFFVDFGENLIGDIKVRGDVLNVVMLIEQRH